MGGDHQDRLGRAMGFAEGMQGGGVGVATQRGHRRTVREEGGGSGGHLLSDAAKRML